MVNACGNDKPRKGRKKNRSIHGLSPRGGSFSFPSHSHGSRRGLPSAATSWLKYRSNGERHHLLAGRLRSFRPITPSESPPPDKQTPHTPPWSGSSAWVSACQTYHPPCDENQNNPPHPIPASPPAHPAPPAAPRPNCLWIWLSPAAIPNGNSAARMRCRLGSSGFATPVWNA